MNYYSVVKRKQLEKVKKAKNTVIEAPVGFGKRTAIKRLFSDIKEQVFWFEEQEKEPEEAYDALVDIITDIDGAAGRKLREVGYPNYQNLEEVCRICRHMKAYRDEYIIFRYTKSRSHPYRDSIFQAIFTNTCEKVHFIILANEISSDSELAVSKEQAYYLGKSFFALTAEEIVRLYADENIPVTESQAAEIQAFSNGWISILSLHILQTKITGTLEINKHIGELIHYHFYDKLTTIEKEVALMASLFSTVTYGQLCFFAGREIMADEKREATMIDYLFEYNIIDGNYEIQPVLGRFLKNCLKDGDESIRRRVYQRVGDWYLSQLDHRMAIYYYFKCKAYESLLNVDFTNLSRVKYKNISMFAIAKEVVLETSEEMKKKHPVALLKLAYIIFSAGEFQLFRTLMSELKVLFGELNDKHLMGEWTLIYAYTYFPDVGEMLPHLEEARNLLNKPSLVMDRKEAAFFSCPSPWSIFYIRPGKEELIGNVRKATKLYDQMTSGRLAGGADLLEGEFYCMSGEFERAKICAYKAKYLAESKEQITIVYGAELLLGRAALASSDFDLIGQVALKIEKITTHYAKLIPGSMRNFIKDVIEITLSSMMVNCDGKTYDSFNDSIIENYHVVGMLMLNYNKIIAGLLKGDIHEVIGNLEAVLQLDRRIKTLTVEHYVYLSLTLCYLSLGKDKEASANLDNALRVSCPDKIYITFARFKKQLTPLFKEKAIQDKYQDHLKEINKIAAPLFKENEVLFKEKLQYKVIEELTKREKEVAKLASEGMRNKEIAEELGITERTVKAHLSVVFQKLHIDRRSSLEKML
ncbi:LuxR family maltose regulon positive regulatory protein [Lachnospiraceae bacterium PFB1-21]